ncbi:hypothetical protein BKA93DRAFT_425705 [Sparassis latifolia]
MSTAQKDFELLLAEDAGEVLTKPNAAGVVSYRGTSQYKGSSTSFCGLACLNFARIAFEKERDLSGEELLKAILDRSTALDIIAICGAWSSNFPVEIGRMSQIPLFSKSLSSRLFLRLASLSSRALRKPLHA